MAQRWVDPLARFEAPGSMLDEAALLRAKKIFAVYADESGSVPSASLAALLRANDRAPSHLEMRELRKGVPDRLSFAQFLDVLKTVPPPSDTLDELLRVLSSFDHQGDGTLDSNELVSAATSIGDVLSEQQCARITALADSKGRVRLAVLAQFLLAN